MLLGAVADDLTGATDLCLMLTREGMRTVQVIGVPDSGFDFTDADAVVVALKSRTIEPDVAIDLSRRAAQALLDAGAHQLIFKYCSTFDSTPKGNIGPVADALLDMVGESAAIVCPAFPENGRTIYQGHLFVGNVLLSDSLMRHHPLTPMTDSSLVRVLQAQTDRTVGLIPHSTVRKGATAIRSAIREAADRGESLLVVDAVANDELRSIGEAVSDMKLITGGSGIALGLPVNFRRAGQLDSARSSYHFDAPEGRSVALAGSCSDATRRQVKAAMERCMPALKIDPIEIAQGTTTTGGVRAWVQSQDATALVYSSTDPQEVRSAQEKLGPQAGEIVEQFLAGVAVALRDNGYRRFVVAGGETSGAVVQALGVNALEIGAEIDPGVPWTLSLGDDQPIALALKSGNFGAEDFFIKAWSAL